MKRIIYSGITKALLAVLLLLSCTAAAFYGFLTFRAPILYGNAKTVYETRQYSELFSKYVERTAVYVRYLEDGYSLRCTSLDSQLELLLEGETAETDLENALYNVYEPSETAFYYYHSKLNEEPTNYKYYVKNTITGREYYSAGLEQYAVKKSGSLENFLSSGIIQENLYLILNTQNNRTMTGGGNTDVLNRSNLLWSMDFLRRPLSEMAEDIYYDYNYRITEDITESNDMDYLQSVSNSGTEATGGLPDSVSSDTDIPGDSADNEPFLPPKNAYLLYAFVADNLVTDEFTELSNNFAAAKEDFENCPQYTVLFSFFSIILFYFAHVLCGRRSADTSVHLHFYDRIFTELILVAILALLLLPAFLWDNFDFYLDKPFSEFVTCYPQYRQWILIILGCLAVFLFLIGILYFSLIRRIKAGTLISSSFVGRFFLLPVKKQLIRLFHSLKEFFANLPALWKTVLYLGGGTVWFLISVVLITLADPVIGIPVLSLGACFCAFVYLRNTLDHIRITRSTSQMSAGNLSARISTESMLPSNKRLSEDINHICDGLHFAVEEQTKSERMKTELITNVSHDIKTPLTSIINYIELIKNELPQEGTVAGYAEILSQKSWRLKALIDDLVEASKAASGTMKLEPIRFNAVELLRQAVGDFEERLTGQNLALCMTLPEAPVNVLADGACTHRIIENMLSNVCKYALPGTRVFISLDLPEGTGLALLTIKNTSAAILSKTPEELLTRFSRGDEARSDEGSGLGLSIAESLAALQGGSFYVETDGDLFKAKLTIPLAD